MWLTMLFLTGFFVINSDCVISSGVDELEKLVEVEKLLIPELKTLASQLNDDYVNT